MSTRLLAIAKDTWPALVVIPQSLADVRGSMADPTYALAFALLAIALVQLVRYVVLPLFGKTSRTGDRDKAWDRLISQTNDMHQIIMTEDTNRPRWPRVWAPIAETIRIQALLEELANLRNDWNEERSEWKKERARLDLRITQLEETIKMQDHALRSSAGGSA